MSIPKHYSLHKVLSSVQRMFDDKWSNAYWIKVEIAKLNKKTSGNSAYPLLVEKKDNRIIAEISSTIWPNVFSRIVLNFENVTKRKFTDGIEVLVYAKVKFSSTYGVSLDILDVDPNFTLGAMELERLKTIEKLKQSNLINKNKEIGFPILPKRIAIISVTTSKGYIDFINTINSNSKNFSIEYELFIAILQGDNAVESIKFALNSIKKRSNEFDIVTIIRGGGGEVGMSCYDNFSLSESVALFPLPVLSGIGHASNLTVVEMVSHTNMITPTALANFIIQQFLDFEDRMNYAKDRIINSSLKTLESKMLKLSNFKNVFKGHVKLLLQREDFEIKRLFKSVISDSHKLLTKHDKLSSDLAVNIKYTAQSRINKSNFELKTLESNLSFDSLKLIEKHKVIINNLSSKVSILDPVNILKRGYSIVRLNGKASNLENVKLGDKILIETYDKEIITQVESVKKNKNI